MIHKLGHITDLDRLVITDPITKNKLLMYLNILDSEYGAERNIDSDDGGYVLYCEDKTSADELKSLFDYSDYTPEYVDLCFDASPPICSAVYLLYSDYGVVIIMSISDTPAEIIDTSINKR